MIIEDVKVKEDIEAYLTEYFFAPNLEEAEIVSVMSAETIEL